MANSATVGILKVLLSANTAEFEAALKRSADAAKIFSRETQAIGRDAIKVGQALTTYITLPIAGLALASAKAAIDFESSFANVAKTVEGVAEATGKLTPAGKALAQTFRDLAKEIPVTTDELNKIAALGGQMGVPIEQLATFTRHVAALGVAVDGISTEEAAAGLAQIGNATGTGTTQIAAMASALVHLGNNSNATEAEILEFTKRLVGAGHAVGMAVPEVMALGTAMANVGINAEAGGSAMSIVISKISKAVSEGGSALTEFARVADRSATDFAAIWKRSPIEAIDLFVKGLSSMRERGVDLNLTMGEIGTEGIRVADTLKRLSGAGDGVAKSLTIANAGFVSANKHLEEAEKKFGTTANQLKLLWNQIRDVGITIGNALLPAIQSLIGMMNTVIPVVDTLAKGFAGLPGEVQLIVLGVGALVAAIGPALLIFGHLTLAASSLAGAFTAKGIATKLLGGNLGLLTRAYAILLTPITLTTAATAAGTGAMTLQALAAKGLTSVLGLLRGALLLIAAHPIIAIATAIGVAATALVTYAQRQAEAALQAQIAGAKQDTIRIALERSKQAGDGWGETLKKITDLEQKYTEAIQYNAEWLAKRDPLMERFRQQLQELQRNGAPAASQIALLTEKVRELAKQGELAPERLRELGEQAAALKKQAGTVPPELQNIINALGIMARSTGPAGYSFDGLAGKLNDAEQEIRDLSATVRNDLVRAINSGAISMEEMREASGLSEVALKLFQDRVKGLTKDAEKAAKELDQLLFIGPRLETDEFEEGLVKYMNALDELHGSFSGPKLDEFEEGIVEHMNALDDFHNSFSGPRLDEFEEGIVRHMNAMDDLANSFSGPIMPDAVRQQREEAERFFGSLIDAVTGFPQLLQQSLTGGGGIMGALQAFGVQIADVLGSAARTALKNTLTDLGKSTVGAAAAFGQLAITGGFMALGEGVRIAFQNAAFEEETRKMRKAFLADFQNTLTEMERKAQKSGTAIRDILTTRLGGAIRQLGYTAADADRMVKGLYDARTPEIFAERLERINDLLDEQNALLEFIDGAAQTFRDTLKKYNADLGDLGAAGQVALLSDRVEELWRDFEILGAGELSVATRARLMKDAFNAFVQDALRAGIAIPRQFEEIIRSLIDQKLLVDANGDAYESLEDAGITFGDTFISVFKGIKDAVDRLVAAIKYDLGLALTDAEKQLLGIEQRLGNNLRPREGNEATPPPSADAPEPNRGTDDPVVRNPANRAPGNFFGSRGGLVTPRGILPIPEPQFFRMGGLVGPRGPDTVAAWLQPGELVIPKGTVDDWRSGSEQGSRQPLTVNVSIQAWDGTDVMRVVRSRPFLDSFAQATRDDSYAVTTKMARAIAGVGKA